jgi:hypothetical protein
LFFACLAPWIWRNWVVFHAFIPIRGNFGVEFYLGNYPESLGLGWGVSVTSQKDLHEYKEMGEAAFVKQRAAMAKADIRRDPRHFLRLCAKRFYMYWVSVPHPLSKSALLEYIREFHYCFLSITGLLGLALAIKKKIPAARLFAVAFLLLPLVYYVVTVGARFRHPLEPLITVLTIFLFQSSRVNNQLDCR